MVQHANRERVIKLPRERQPIDISLNDVRVWQRARRCEGSLNGRAEVDTDNFLRSPARGKLRVTALAATAFKHHLVAKKLRRYRRDPTEKLFSVTRVVLGEVLPLPTEVRRRRLLITLDVRQWRETRNTTRNRKRCNASAALQCAFHYLLLFDARDGQIESTVTRWTDEIRE